LLGWLQTRPLFLPTLNFVGANKMSIRVLIVDHHEQIRRLVRAFFLSEFGYQICGEAVDGYEAIMKAQLLRPDLIVLEVAMPRLNGVEAAPKLKKLLPKTPIILFTLHASLLKGCDTREIGVDAVVAKQDGMSALGDSVNALFTRSPVTSTTK
jgi:NarL family two-component system response regulator LiaR